MILDESLTSRELRAVDMNAAYLGVSTLQLMENAGRAVADAVINRFKPSSQVAVVCGPGGNGGDGFVAARHLAGAGYAVEVFLLGQPDLIRHEDARANWNSLQRMRSSIRVTEIRDSSQIPPLNVEVIIDALLGTGVRGPLTSPYREMVQAINESSGFKLAVDVPTGLESDTGAVAGVAISADLTLTFHKSKPGFRKGREFVGELIVCPIGVPPEAELFTGPGDVHLVNKPRPPESHKGDFGYVLVVGGSETYSGAPTLTALGAYAIGVDLVYVAAPETASSIIAGFSPSLVTLKLKGGHLTPKSILQIQPFLERVNAVAMGPGLGLNEETVEAVNTLIEWVEGRRLPLVMDADALKGFAPVARKLGNPKVYTPHAGEFKILTGKQVTGDYKEHGKIVQAEAARLGGTILLKGDVDVISDGAHTRYNWTGNPGMTVGGTGDVLTGITAGFMAMGFTPFESAAAGAFINGAAGDAAYDDKGFHIVPTDVVERVPRVVEDALAGRLKSRR